MIPLCDYALLSPFRLNVVTMDCSSNKTGQSSAFVRPCINRADLEASLPSGKQSSSAELSTTWFANGPIK